MSNKRLVISLVGWLDLKLLFLLPAGGSLKLLCLADEVHSIGQAAAPCPTLLPLPSFLSN